MTLVAQTAGLAAAGGLLVAAPAAKVALTAPGHSPKTNAHWNYSVKVTRAGKPATATITAQIVDPIGGVHVAQLGTTKKDVKALPFKGTFHDFLIWPADSRGIPLTFRLTVESGPTKKVINYSVTPR
jgi:hypothetical protein